MSIEFSSGPPILPQLPADQPQARQASPVTTQGEGFVGEDATGCCHHNKLAMAFQQAIIQHGVNTPLFAQFLEPVEGQQHTGGVVGQQSGGPGYTTMAMGEEDDGGQCPKPPVIAPSCGQPCDKPTEPPMVTTMAVGEEDDAGHCPKPPVEPPPVVTTLMIGEEDDMPSCPPCDKPAPPQLPGTGPSEPPAATTFAIGEEDDSCSQVQHPVGNFLGAFDGMDSSFVDFLKSLFPGLD